MLCVCVCARMCLRACAHVCGNRRLVSGDLQPSYLLSWMMVVRNELASVKAKGHTQ